MKHKELLIQLKRLALKDWSIHEEDGEEVHKTINGCTALPQFYIAINSFGYDVAGAISITVRAATGTPLKNWTDIPSHWDT